MGPSLATSSPGGLNIVSVPSAQKLPGLSAFVSAKRSSSGYPSSVQGPLRAEKARIRNQGIMI